MRSLSRSYLTRALHLLSAEDKNAVAGAIYQQFRFNEIALMHLHTNASAHGRSYDHMASMPGFYAITHSALAALPSRSIGISARQRESLMIFDISTRSL